MRFTWDSLLGQVCSFLRRGPAVVELSVDECGAIGSFVSDEIRLHAVEMSTEHVSDFQHRMDGLVAFMQTDSSTDAAIERIVRFLRGQN